jgi:hypothetical protein
MPTDDSPRPASPTGEPATVRHYAFRVRGDVRRACIAAREEGLEVEVRPESTTARGWLPDQAALFGMLARIHLRGLEIAAAHRTPSLATQQTHHTTEPDDVRD